MTLLGGAIARGAAALVAGVGDLRNDVGVAHGATAPRSAPMAQARLAARAALAAVHFLLDERATPAGS